ncbi:MAG: flagellar assembly protein FliW [Desulfobacteraceae bacterium]|nr:flagellar assembly protein FliW [Desulfobacteraceae bacterium]
MANTAGQTITAEAGEQVLRVKTSRFGEIEVAAGKVIHMTSPFLGFPGSHRFLLRPHAENSPFMWLQSLDEPQLAFVVIRPALIRPDYQPPLPAAARRELRLRSGDVHDLLLILTIPEGKPEKMTANMLGPVAINISERLAKQVLLDPNRYEACWPVFMDE